MNDLLNQWLDARLNVPGMLACGAASPNMPADAEGICRTTDNNFSVSKLSYILRLLQSTPTAPDTQSSALKWRTWVFSNCKIRSAVRPDGWRFAAVVLANSDAAQILDPLTEEFLALKPAG